MLLVKNIGLLATAEGNSPLRGAAQHEGVKLIKDAAVLINDGIIHTVYENGSVPSVGDSVEIIDAGGRLVTAGLVDNLN